MEKPTLDVKTYAFHFSGCCRIFLRRIEKNNSISSQGYTILDFSIYDVLQTGFRKFVFIIRWSFERVFKEIFDEQLTSKSEISYVYQELYNE